MLLYQSEIRSEAHAFLDGVLPPLDGDYTAEDAPKGLADAYNAGRKLRGKHPRAECADESVEKDGGRVPVYSVYSDPAR